MKKITTTDLFSATTIESYDIHPNGKIAICSINRGENWELATLDLRTGRLRSFARGEQSLTGPTYSPDGGAIAYHVDFEGDEDHDIVIAGTDGRKSRKLTDGVADNYSAEFSPDGRSVAFISNRDKDVENLYVIPGTGGRVRKLTREEVPVVQYAWSPDGSRIIYHAGVSDEDTVSVVDVKKAKPRQVLARRGVEFALAGGYGPCLPWSADGRSILFLSNENDFFDIGELDIETGKKRWLVRSKSEKYQPQRSPDGRRLAYLEVKDPDLQLKVKSGARTSVVSTKDGLSRYARWLPDGSGLAYVNGSATRPEELFVTRTTRPIKVTRFLGRTFDPRELAYPKLVRFPSADGLMIPALLYVPKDRSRKAGVVLPHGGPEAQTLNEWDQLPQMLVAKGFTVIMPNYRGSTGYGRKFLHLHNRDLGGADVLDTVYAGKYLLDKGYAREDRLGYWGASYSGYTCMHSLERFPDMWSAAVCIVGFFDWFTEIESERGYLKAYDHKKMGYPDKEPERFRQYSPINFLDQVRAPLLMTASARDVRCPPTEARAVVRRLTELGRKPEYHEYPDEGHWPRKRKNLRDLYERSVRFLDGHMER